MQSKLYLLLFPFIMGAQLCATCGTEALDPFIIESNESNPKMLNQKKSGQLLIQGQDAFKLSWFEASPSLSTQPGLSVTITSPDLCGLKLLMIFLRLPLPKSLASKAE